jgi:hypothetical protein
MLKKLIGIILIIAAFIVEGMWLSVTFGTVIVGIVLLLFAPGILFAPFNILFAMGVAFLSYEENIYTKNNYYNNKSYKEDFNRSYEGVPTPDLGMEKYYSVLNCNVHDNFETVRKAYRKLSREYHPDAIQGKGLSDSFVTFATEKMQEINEAYTMIKKEKEGCIIL